MPLGNSLVYHGGGASGSGGRGFSSGGGSAYPHEFVIVPWSSSITLDLTQGDEFSVVLDPGLCTFQNPTGALNGQRFAIILHQPGSLGTVAFGSKFRFHDIPETVTPIAPKIDFSTYSVVSLFFVYSDSFDEYFFLGQDPPRWQESEIVIPYAATINIDALAGNVFHVELAGNPTIAAPSNPMPGRRIMIRLLQDGTGNRTVTWNAIFNFSSSLPSPTLSTAAAAFDYLAFVYNGVNSTWDFVGYVNGF